MTAETKENQLVDLLLTDTAGKSAPESTDSTFLETLMEQKIHRDFEIGNTVNVKGWVLSATEARQCALFSIGQ
jgi:hypothetical protein